MATWGYRMIGKMRLLTGANSMQTEIMDQETPWLVTCCNRSLKKYLGYNPFSCDEIYMWTLLLHGRSLLTGYNLNKLKALYINIRYSFIYRVPPPYYRGFVIQKWCIKWFHCLLRMDHSSFPTLWKPSLRQLYLHVPAVPTPMQRQGDQ